MVQSVFSSYRPAWAALAAASLLAACGGGGGGGGGGGFPFVPPAPSPGGGSTPSEARPGTLQSCTDLAAKAAFGSTVYTSVSSGPPARSPWPARARPRPSTALCRAR